MGRARVRILLGGIAFVHMARLAAPTFAQTAQIGEWTGVQTWPVEAIHTSLMPNGKVLFWQSWRESVGIWNPTTNQFETAGLPFGGGGGQQAFNPFCSGHAWLPDGRLLVAGGHIQNYNGENRADIYDPFTNTWARVNNSVPDVPNMGSTSTNTGTSGKRWYPSATSLGNGDVLVMSGDVVTQGVTNRTVQVYRYATNTWDTLTNALRPENDLLPEYPRVFLGPDGRAVVISDNSDDTEFLNLSGEGSWTYMSEMIDSNTHNYGPSVMYDTGKIANFGGGHNPTKHIAMLDLNASNPHWEHGLEDMAQGRRHNNATILADGTVLITGGSSKEGWNDQTGFVAQAELWNPDTQEVTPMASASSIYRGYHSTALLLPDGRVLVTGGNHDETSGIVEQKNAEIYSPPYLFKGARPTVTNAPDVVEMGDTIFVETPDAADISKALWVIPGSVTHAQNWTQRANTLDFSLTDGGLNIELPANTNLAPAGYYMLFLVNSNGVPSMAEWVRATTITDEPDNADFNGDLIVDGADLLVLQQHLMGPAGMTHADGDANDDGVVDADDYNIWLTQFASTPVQVSATSAIPEPSLAALLCSAALAASRRVAVSRRRKKRG